MILKPRSFSMHDLHRDWQKWTRTERFSAVIIFAAMVTVVVPAAVEFTHQTASATAAHHHAMTPAH